MFAHDVPVVRRSSQLSFSILAILDAEVPNTQRLLLERTMLFLLAVAKGQVKKKFLLQNDLPPKGPNYIYNGISLLCLVLRDYATTTYATAYPCSVS